MQRNWKLIFSVGSVGYRFIGKYTFADDAFGVMVKSSRRMSDLVEYNAIK